MLLGGSDRRSFFCRACESASVGVKANAKNGVASTGAVWMVTGKWCGDGGDCDCSDAWLGL